MFEIVSYGSESEEQNTGVGRALRRRKKWPMLARPANTINPRFRQQTINKSDDIF